MNIDILLPFKEKFSKNKASAVSITVKNSMKYSSFKNKIKVYGQKVEKPFYKKHFIGLKNNWILHGGHNKSLAHNYYKKNKNNDFQKKILEIHNRPYLFNYLFKKIKNIPITLHFHNDPQEMKGSKTIKEREYIAKSAAGIYFVSEFIKNKFLEGLKQKYNNIYVLYNSVERKHLIIPNKKRQVLFVGRLVPEKGAHIYTNVIKKIAKDFENWKFILIGSSKAGQEKTKTSYEAKIIKDFKSIGHNVKYLGFLDNRKVNKSISDASILVIPSIWDEPLCLVAIEGLCHASAIISSNKGGLPEVIKDKGIKLKNINEVTLRKQLVKLLSNSKLIKKYQKKAWAKYEFNSSKLTKKQDSIRLRIIKDFYLKK